MVQHADSGIEHAAVPDWPHWDELSGPAEEDSARLRRATAQRPRRWRRRAKRALDVVGSLVLLVVMVPVFCLIALAVRLEGGRVLYRHRRVGLHGTEFACLKFRTMPVNAEAQLDAILRANPALREEWQRTRKIRRDPRVGRLGRILRSTSLDELPQLINVLRGEMSLVGPRPVPRTELETCYDPLGKTAYLSVRPGITGPWQVSGRTETDYPGRVSLDIAYVRDHSLRLDLAILARTVLAVLRRRGAC